MILNVQSKVFEGLITCDNFVLQWQTVFALGNPSFLGLNDQKVWRKKQNFKKFVDENNWTYPYLCSSASFVFFNLPELIYIEKAARNI